MSILLNKDSKILVQGITGAAACFMPRMCREYGTKIVAGVTPGKGGIHVEGIPVFNTVEEAVRITGANVSMIFVPPPAAADAILEAADAGIELAVCITEGIPVRDMVPVKQILDEQPHAPGRPQLPRRHHPRTSARSGSCPAISTKRGRSAWFRAAAPSPTRRSSSSPMSASASRPASASAAIRSSA